MPRHLPLAARFEANYIPEPNSGCWIWVGPTFSRYDGQSPRGKIDGRSATRTSFEMHKGPVQTGLLVCHSCDTPLCVNPNHLWLGTHADNMKDKLAKGRTARGRKYPVKLTAEKAGQIRASAASVALLADRYGVHPKTIQRIRNGRTWSATP